jgi:LPS O-antigen subunit length determinant protein (WzzB/FepE family)
MDPGAGVDNLCRHHTLFCGATMKAPDEESREPDWKKLLDATAEAIDQAEMRIRVCLPFLEQRCDREEIKEIKQTLASLRSLRKKVAGNQKGPPL